MLSCYHAIMLYAWMWYMEMLCANERKSLVLQWVLAIDLTSKAMQSFPIIPTIVALSCLLELDSLLQYFIFRYISYFGLYFGLYNMFMLQPIQIKLQEIRVSVCQVLSKADRIVSLSPVRKSGQPSIMSLSQHGRYHTSKLLCQQGKMATHIHIHTHTYNNLCIYTLFYKL